ncbi:MAG: hypothetical protein GY856_10095 [bacterium]|nr:hypothetical protein [bacterium]
MDTVLLGDDSNTALSTAGAILALEAQDAREGIEPRTEVPGLILMDFQRPKIDWFESCKRRLTAPG